MKGFVQNILQVTKMKLFDAMAGHVVGEAVFTATFYPMLRS